ncbi:hypothetical protein [Leucobacter soli]|uniref:hypothetical protein n=1 Tax=Leucobacter soli TaxID=2812850 RepID=UPI0036170A6F
MTLRRARSTVETGGRRRGAIAFLAVVTLAVAGLTVAPVAAEAASRPTVSLEATIGADRIVAVRLACTFSSACQGKIVVTLGSGGRKTINYRIAKRKSATLTWKLSKNQYQKFVKRGSAKLAVTGSTVKPSKRSFSKSRTVRPAKAKLSLSQTNYAIAKDRTLPLALTCAASTGCAATVALQTSSGGSVARTTVTAKKGATSVMLRVPASAYASLGDAAVAYRVVISETRPDAVQSTRTVRLTKAIPVRTASVAYAQRNWTPTEYDTCPASLHESYRTVGPDGKYYPTWHPAEVTDPATGRLCTFGHEHGADPASSDIAEWVADHFAPDDLVEGEPRGLPFGYASEELDNHIAAGHDHLSMRHEDNGGHKVFVRNNVGLVDADHRSVTFENASGSVSGSSATS